MDDFVLKARLFEKSDEKNMSYSDYKNMSYSDDKNMSYSDDKNMYDL